MPIINQPFALLVIPVLVVSLTMMWLVVKQYRAVVRGIIQCWMTTWTQLATKAAFFWFVNLVFMAVSVLHAGLFFALLEPESGFFGLAPLLGFAVALTLDLASIVFMQARLSALRMHEKRSAGWYLFSIVACSGLSAFGNLAMSLQDFDPARLNHAGSLIQRVSPWLGVAFPLLIILISIASDKVLDVDPTEHLDVEAYRKLEQRRIAILVERNNFLEQQVEQDRRREDIKRREKDSKRRKREPSREAKPPSPTELEQAMARLEALQEQVRQLSAASPALVNGQQGQSIAPPSPETPPMHLFLGQVIQQEEQRPLTIGAPKEPEDMDSFEVRFAMSYLDRHPSLKQQVLDLYHQDPQAAPARIAALVKQQDGLAGVTPALVSHVFTRLVSPARHAYLTHALVNRRENTARSVEETANGHHVETIPVTHWSAESVGSEQETGHIGEAEQTPIRPRTEQQTRPIADDPRSTQRTADSADCGQETLQPPDNRENGEMLAGRVSEERWRAVEVDARSPVNGHHEGQDDDPSVHASTNTTVNNTASTGAHLTGNTERPASGQPGVHRTERPGEQEARTEATLEVNSVVNTETPAFPSTGVNSRPNTPTPLPNRSRASTPSGGTPRSGKGQGSASRPRGEASQRVRRVLKKDPTISITRLSEKANVSRGYASQVRAQVLSEHRGDTSTGA